MSRGLALQTFAAALFTVSASFGCKGTGPATEDGTADSRLQPDVLIITLDTARADRFSYAGPSPVRTPNIDALAAAGSGFTNAIAPVPVTLPSHASIFTGQRPTTHGVRGNGTFKLKPDASTLAEYLRAEGYATAAFIGASVLDSRYGLDQGFDTYDDDLRDASRRGMFVYPERKADRVVEAAATWLAQQGAGPTLVWVHLFDAHGPYDPPEPEKSRFPGAPYDGEIAFVDRAVGTLLNAYRTTGRFERMIAIVTSDHGESLGEHGEATHGVLLHDATVRVPLVIRIPRHRSESNIVEQVRLVDIAPTVLDALGMPAVGGMEGRSLLPLIDGRRVADPPPVYIETLLPELHYGWAALRGVRTAQWKLVSGVHDELFDLGTDPDENTDVAGKFPDATSELRRLLAVDYTDPGLDDDANIDMNEEIRAELAALGYVWAPQNAAATPSAPRPDPRNKVELLLRMDEATNRAMSGDAIEGLNALSDLMSQDPKNPTLARRLGHVAAVLGELKTARDAFERAVELAPRDVELWGNLGAARQWLGDTGKAVSAYEQALKLDPSDRLARHNRWQILLDEGRENVVRDEASALLATTRADPAAQLALILATSVSQPPSARLAALLRASADHPSDNDILVALARAYEDTGDQSTAIKHYRKAVARTPGHEVATVRLGRLLLFSGEVSAALTMLTAAQRRTAQTPDYLMLLAQARFRTGNAEGALRALQHAGRVAPRRADVWGTLGAIQLVQKQIEPAIESYEKAVALGLRDAPTWTNLALAYDAAGRSPEAAEARRKLKPLAAQPRSPTTSPH